MRITPFLLLSLVLSSGDIEGQQPSGTLLGPAIGVSMDRFMYHGAGTTAMSFRFSALRPSAVGTEIGVSLFPEVLPAGILLLAPDLGAAYNISFPNATLLIKAGGSALTGIGQGFALYPGLHAGGGLVLRIDDRTGLRIDVVRHYYKLDAETQPIWSVGFGFTALPRRPI